MKETEMLHVPSNGSARIGSLGFRFAILCIVVTAGILATTNVAYGLGVGGPTQAFPKSWPEELQPFLKQTWTWEHGKAPTPSYHMAFGDREEFESAWPHILKLCDKETTIWLMNGPRVQVWTTKPPKGKRAGVIIQPVRQKNRRKSHLDNTIALVVDGKIVDLNRIRLPADLRIVDERTIPNTIPSTSTKPKPVDSEG